MTPRDEALSVPDSDRYLCVDIDGASWHFRFPSYGKAARMMGLLQGMDEGEGVAKLAHFMDAAGYVIGACWYSRGYALDAGVAPPVSGDWQSYGDAVIDELQERGLSFGAIRSMFEALVAMFGDRMADMAGAEDEAGN